MNAEYWGVGASTSGDLSFTPEEVSEFLLADWMPGVAPTLARSFLGWPYHLLQEAARGKHAGRTILRADAGFAERQWKGVLSWMLGVAGARRVLREEGYPWIAPASAFYPEHKKSVAIGPWAAGHEPPHLVASVARGSASQLRPDYIAVRRGLSGYEWAAVEAKGTASAIANWSRPPGAWAAQVRNIELEHLGHTVPLSRHLVVATRVNPNAKREATRKVQIRAWNSARAVSQPLESSAHVHVVLAHLIGVLSNLNLAESALALALSEFAGTGGVVREAVIRGRDASINGELAGSGRPVPGRAELVERAKAELRDRDMRRWPWQVPVPGVFLDADISSATATLVGDLLDCDTIATAAATIARAEDAETARVGADWVRRARVAGEGREPGLGSVLVSRRWTTNG